jgi:penicillin-binding protein 1A
MGVRDSTLEAVPSLALGTSPVTIKEMVSAYSTIANDGMYLEPRMVTSIEDRNGNVLAQFDTASPERALAPEADRTLIDVMRDVVNRGTGAAIRSRYGIRADVAGKTGTTQDNADGWFILMQPQLVAGAWVGFDDGRVTFASSYWGEGAHTALPIVGDFYQRALRARLIDSHARFDTDVQPGVFDQFRDKLSAWMSHLFGAKTPAPVTTGGTVVHRVVPKAASVTPAPVAPSTGAGSGASNGGVPLAPASSTSPSSATPREVPPLLGTPHEAASGAAGAGSGGLSASEAAALLGEPSSAVRSNGGLPTEGSSSTPTPTPDLPETSGGGSQQP